MMQLYIMNLLEQEHCKSTEREHIFQERKWACSMFSSDFHSK